MNDYDHEDMLAYFNNLDVIWERPAGNLDFRYKQAPNYRAHFDVFSSVTGGTLET